MPSNWVMGNLGILRAVAESESQRKRKLFCVRSRRLIPGDLLTETMP